MADDQAAPLQDDEEEQSQMPAELAAAILGGGTQPGAAPGAGTAPSAAPAAPAPPPTDDQQATGQSSTPGTPFGSTEDLEGRAAARYPSYGPRVAPGSTEDLENRAQASRTAATAPAATDDDEDAVPTAPDLSNSPLAKLLAQTQDTQSKLAAVPKPDPTQLRPRLWERLLGFAAGTAAGMKGDTALAGQISRNVTGRRMAQAQSDYNAQTSPLKAQLDSEREGLGMAEAQSKIPQQNFQNQMEVTKEKREQSSAKSLAEHREDLDDIKQQIANNNLQGAQDRIDQKQKELESSASFKQSTLDLKQQLGNLQLDLRAKELASKQSPNGYTPDESREIASKSRRFQTRVDSLEKQRGDYIGSSRPEDKQTLTAIDDEIEQNHQKIDAVEQDVIGRRQAKPGAGGTPKPAAPGTPAKSPQAAAATAPAKPAAQPTTAPDPGLWKDKTKVLVTRNQASGNVQRWQLQNGKPVLLSEDKK